MGKFIIFVLAVIASAAGGTAYYLKVEAQRTELDEAAHQLADIKSETSRKALVIIPKRQENSDLQAKIEQVDKVTAANETLAAQIPVLETALAEVTREFVDAVSKVRAASVGTALPNLTLASGQLLEGVRIVKIADTEITLAHNGGSARVPGSSLPADLRDRLRIDMSPMVNAARTLAVAVAGPSAAPPPGAGAGAPLPDSTSPGVASTEAAVGEPPSAPPLTAAQRTKIDDAETTLRQQEKQEAELRRTRNAYLAQVQDYRIKDERSKFMGQPQKYQKVIPQITKAINDIDNQLSETSAKIATLQMRVSDLKDGAVQ